MSSPFFPKTLKSLIGFSVGIFSNDGALIKGTLVDIKKDYLILQNKEGKYIYHHLSQIRSVSKNAKDIHKNVIKKDYLQAEQLHEILEQCKYSWITVNCYNDQFVTGMLSRVFDDHLILISEEEQIIVQKIFISNVFPGVYEPPASENAAEAIETTTANQNKKYKAKRLRLAEKKTETVLTEKSIKKESSFLEEEKQIKQRERKQSKEFVTHNQKNDSTPDKLANKEHEEKNTAKAQSFDKQHEEKNTAKAQSFDKQHEEKNTVETRSFIQQMNEENTTKIQKVAKKDLFARKYRHHSSSLEKKKKAEAKFVHDKEEQKLLVQLPILDNQENCREKVSSLPVEEIEQQLESQYYSLMKQAEKKYMTLRKKRMEREMMND